MGFVSYILLTLTQIALLLLKQREAGAGTGKKVAAWQLRDIRNGSNCLQEIAKG